MREEGMRGTALYGVANGEDPLAGVEGVETASSC